MSDAPQPGQVEFSADEERQMRESSAANRGGDDEGAGAPLPERQPLPNVTLTRPPLPNTPLQRPSLKDLED